MSGRVERALRSSTRFLRDWSAAGRDAFYPPACAWCRRHLEPTTDSRLCQPCRASLIPSVPDRCERCSAPVGPHLDTTSGCIHCRDEHWKFGRSFALGAYADSLREACLRLKQPRSESLAAALAVELTRHWAAEWRDNKYDLIVPVPHHWRQRLWRTQLVPITLARTISRLLQTPVELAAIRKVKYTPLQSSLTATERRANLRGAFAPEGGVRLRGGRMLIVDDVLTTGTTADRVARVLLELGAERVDAAVIARGLKH